MIEGVPNCLLWVSYEDVFVRFWVRVSPAKALASQPQTLRNDNFGFLPNQCSYGVVSTDLDGALFKVNVVVSRAYPQNDSGKSVRDIVDRTISYRVRLRRSDTPLR